MSEPTKNIKKSALVSFLIVTTCLFIGGCDRYTLTQSDILSRYPQNLIIRSEGDQGPYKELTGFVGNPDMPISASWNSPDGLVKVDWPAEKGYYFQVNGYENKQKGIFWVLLKLPNQQPTP